MELSLLSQEGVSFLLRWMHFFFGIIWIGLLYYFNFVQGAFFNETDAGAKSAAIQKLVPRALWWFRWGAMWTLVSGLGMIMINAHAMGMEYFATSRGISILIGGSLGILMWFNVWFVIWPSQKIVIASAVQAAAGKGPIAEAAAAGARAGVASRTNTLFSIPLLFFMGATRALFFEVDPMKSGLPLAVILAVIILGIELNALKGKMGPMASIKGVITCGFALTGVIYLLLEALL